ncbi:hypothetical protein V2W45_1348718 [Cenococcum geophilum]
MYIYLILLSVFAVGILFPLNQILDFPTSADLADALFDQPFNGELVILHVYGGK